MNRIFFLGVLILLFLPFCSSAHYVVGIANDARDGTQSDGHEIVVWNPNNGIADNLTDTIGPTGNSYMTLYYMVDCDLLETSCQIGDTLRAKVYNTGDDYISEEVSILITSSGFDLADNLTLNSLPEVSLVSPVNFENSSNSLIDFECDVSDLDSNLENVFLWGNWSGWGVKDSASVSGNSDEVIFSLSVPEGNYIWGCGVQDNLSISTFSENNSLFVDITPPEVSEVSINESYLCGNDKFARVSCEISDNLGIEKIVLISESPTETNNLTMSVLAGDVYYRDVLLDEYGEWNFECFAEDKSSNINFSKKNALVYSDLPELIINSSLDFSNENPIEDTAINVSAVIYNNGCQNANNLFVGLYSGNPESGGIFLDSKEISLTGLNSLEVVFSWLAQVGSTDFFIWADSEESFSEILEDNNKNNREIDVSVWQSFYGNVSANKILNLESSNNFSMWGEKQEVSGNVFVTDKEARIDWTALLAIGKNTLGGDESNDFDEIDSSIGTDSFKDSVESVFSNSGTPKNKETFFIHRKNITEVPIVNSSDDSPFITGILWDSSDDTNGEYDSSEKEDLVFVAKVSKNTQGAYGVYDYEVKVPVELRDYDSSDVEEVYFYYDLV